MSTEKEKNGYPQQVISEFLYERYRLCFLVLLYLVKNNAIHKEVPMGGFLQELVQPFLEQKLGKATPEEESTETFSGSEVAWLRKVSTNNSQEDNEQLLKLLNTDGLKFIKRGDVYLWPDDRLEGFTCKLSVQGKMTLDTFNQP
ncbi:MAG: hypothetical protein J6V89_05650 [Acetobacter sp.]|nr:hypothetical protein [Acetobacter sp.]